MTPEPADSPPLIRLGVDLGGTKIEAAALGRDGRFLARRRTPNPGGYDGAIRAVRGLLEAVCAESGADLAASGAGFAIPGSENPATGRIRNANTTWLNGTALAADLAAALGAPVRLANDANCFALSEATDGAAAGMDPVFAVIIGTGCGGGLVVDGRLVTGANGIAGEWGHTPLPWPGPDETPGPACWCGRRGCMETWVSGPALSADHARVTGRERTAQEIAEAARSGEAGAVAALDRYAGRLARGLAAVIDMIDPAAIVLGGGLSNIDMLYNRLEAAIRPHVFSDAWSAAILRAAHGDSSGVRGAAWLWKDERP